MAERAGLLTDAAFQQALTYVLEVLPPSRTFSGLSLDGAFAVLGGIDAALDAEQRRLASN